MARVANPKFEFNILDFGIKIPRSKQSAARDAVKEFVLDEVLSRVGSAESPVKGERKKFAALSKDYKKLKRKESGSTIANLELSGDMLDALTITNKGNILKLIVEGQAGKSDGHNDHSGRSKLPKRRFIPGNKQSFRKDIEDGIKDILEEFTEDVE